MKYVFSSSSMLNLGEDRLLHDVLRGEHLVVETKAPSEASHGGSGVLPPPGRYNRSYCESKLIKIRFFSATQQTQVKIGHNMMSFGESTL